MTTKRVSTRTKTPRAKAGRKVAARNSRRIGDENSATRAQLLDAAETLMRNEGYAAVSSRRVAAVANLTPQLVHYYFRTMDDLFIALWERFAQRNFLRHARALESKTPLREMWNTFRSTADMMLEAEFLALAHHRKAIRARLARDGDEFRRMQLERLSRTLKEDPSQPYPHDVLTVLLTSVSRTLVLEAELGMTVGHCSTVRAVEELLDRLDKQLRRPRA